MMGEYRYQIRDTQTGETVIRSFKRDKTNRCDFWWTEGNFGCDCNRGLEFARGQGRAQSEIEEDDYPCSGIKGQRYVYDWVEADGVRFIENDKPNENATSHPDD